MQIKKITSDREASLSDSNKSMKIPRKKKEKTGVSCSNKTPKRVHSRHHGIQRYCVICEKSGMPERKYTSHSSKDCTFVLTRRSIKDVLGGPMGSSIDPMKQYRTSENRCKKELKSLKKHNKMQYRVSKKSSLHHEIKNIKKNREKTS